jgi:hypothetical protein
MRKILILLLLFSGPVLTAYPQQEEKQSTGRWGKFIHVEAGFIYPEGSIKESIPIRQNPDYFYVSQYSDGNVWSETYGFTCGVRYEYYLSKLKSGISAGLRYYGFETDINGFTSGNAEFFYLRYTMDDTDIRFARVNALSESKHLITVPVELRVVPLQYRRISFFARAGIEYSIISLGHKTGISFHDENMNAYKDEVLGGIANTTISHFSAFYSSVGLKLGREGKPNYMFEVLLPSFFLTDNNFSLTDTDSYSGFRLSVQFPVNNK